MTIPLQKGLQNPRFPTTNLQNTHRRFYLHSLFQKRDDMFLRNTVSHIKIPLLISVKFVHPIILGLLHYRSTLLTRSMQFRTIKFIKVRNKIRFYILQLKIRLVQFVIAIFTKP